MPKEFGVLNESAVALYFDYHSENGKLSNLVKNNAGKDKMELICLLLKESKEYGLSDLQVKKLINFN